MVVPAMDKLPRVPDAHGDIVDEKLFSDLYIRTSWVDANVALDQIKKGKARGRRSAIYIRSVFQSHLDAVGLSLQRHAGKVLFVAILVLSTFCVGLKSATIHSKVEQLWIQEGGRLEQELRYTQKSLGEMDSTTHQLLIQTPKDPDASVLHAQALLTHLEVLRKAIAVTVQMYDITWSLREMCNVPTIPQFPAHFIEQIVENIIPCSIITPLDCFWEGAKLLGPDYPVSIPEFKNKIQWTSMDPQKILDEMKQTKFNFPFETLEHYMKRAGISTGYTEKPCLDPRDPQCPKTAANFNSTLQLQDVGAELTGGCYSYAAKYMHWPEELIVGGVKRNKTRHLKKAKALQTVIQLMTEREMYDTWMGHYKVHHIGWSQEKAASVLNAWQKKFSSEINKIMKSESLTNSYNVYAFSSATLDDILERYSNASPISLGIGVLATLVYASVVLIRWRDTVRGQAAVGIAGVLLIGMSTAAGLGLCALLGIAFNAATTQVVPFLALGLGVDHIFTLTHAYAKAESDKNEQTRFILKKVGPTILFSGSVTIASCLAAVIIPVPALKGFSLQSAVVLSFNLAASLLVFPALITLDLRRRASRRNDFFCCCLPAWNTPIPSVPSSHCQHNTAPTQQTLLKTSSAPKRDIINLSMLARKYYAPLLSKSSVKFCAMLTFAITLGASVFASFKLQDGLDMVDLVPHGTNEHKFLSAQSSLFGFYNMFAVTQDDVEYPMNQKLIHEYHEAFVRVPHIIKNDNGGLPDFWLGMFRDWLINLQVIFDREVHEGRITQERWFANATSDGILAYKLIVQTGHVENPVDKSLVSSGRLVDPSGIINPRAFYNYLSAWASNDVFSYGASQGKLRPEPRQYYHAAEEFDLKIPKSMPLTYAQMPFYLHGLTDTSDIKLLIAHIRELCQKFEARGLPNYPSGIPFIFWEQYMSLRSSLVLILGGALTAAFILTGILLLSGWAATLVVFNAAANILQLLGVMTVIGIKLSAIPAVILVLSVGLSVSVTLHVTLGFITAVGGRDRRMKLALESSLAPSIHAIATSTLAVLMLSTSPFEFIVRHFFWLLLSVMFATMVNGLFFYPVLLTLIGPAPELVPLTHPERISTPSPPPVHRQRRGPSNRTLVLNSGRSSKSKSHHKGIPVNSQGHNNEPSLTTITEEPPSWKSSSSSISTGPCMDGGGHHHELQSIVVQPEVTVETHHGGGGSGCDQTTKVTATANIKVELVTPGRATRCYTTSTTNNS